MRSKPFHLFALALAAALAAGAAQAQTGAAAKTAVTTAPSAPAGKPDPRAEIVKKVGGIKLEDVRITPVNGIYEVTRDAEISYVSSDGHYAILGDMIDLDSDDNISEARRRGVRARMLDSIPESEMLVFAPKEPAKYTITVFTDIDCGYCRRLHSQIAEYNRLGIRVRYLFFPRSGGVVRVQSQRRAHARQERRSHRFAEVSRRHHQAGLRTRPEARGGRNAGHFPREWRDAAWIRAADAAREVPEVGKNVRGSARERAWSFRFREASSSRQHLPTAWHQVVRAFSPRSPAISSTGRH